MTMSGNLEFGLHRGRAIRHPRIARPSSEALSALDRDWRSKIGRALFGKPPSAAELPGSDPLASVVHAAGDGEGSHIVTDRLVLRHFRGDDFENFAEMLADPTSFRYSERGPMDTHEAWRRMLRHFGHWALMGYGPFAVEEKTSGRFVGEVGLSDFRRGLGPRFDGVPEASWMIARWARGRGYALEAAAAAHAWIDLKMKSCRTVCLIHSGNSASVRIADRLGYAVFAECEYRSYPALLLERNADRVSSPDRALQSD